MPCAEDALFDTNEGPAVRDKLVPLPSVNTSFRVILERVVPPVF